MEKFKNKKQVVNTNISKVSEETIIHRHGFSKKNAYIYFEESPYLGFELEVDCEQVKEDFQKKLCEVFYQHKSQHYTVEKDSTLTNGAEIVFQPHSFSELKNYLNTEFAEVLKKLKEIGCQEFAPKAGFHLHVSKTLFGETDEVQQDNVAKIWKLLSNYPNKFIAIGHRINLKYSTFTDLRLEFNSLFKHKVRKEWSKKNYRKIRYQAINVINPNTVEFRFFQSSLNLNLLNFWIDLVYYISNKSCEISWTEVDSWNAWFSDFPYNIEDFC